MRGYLINGVWLSAATIEAIIYLIRDGGTWRKAPSIKEWNATSEPNRALQIQANGIIHLIEAPTTIEVYEGQNLLNGDPQMVAPQKRKDAIPAATQPAAGPGGMAIA